MNYTVFNIHNRAKGFSAIEILIVVGIIGMIAGIVLVSFSNMQNKMIIAIETENITSLVSRARADTLSSRNDMFYSVHLENNRAIMFAGTTFVESEPGNVEVIFDPRVTITNLALAGGGNDVIFSKVSGTTDYFGTFRVSLVSDSSSYKTVSIYKTGLIDIQ